MKQYLLTFCMLCLFIGANAQTEDKTALKAMKSAKEAEVAALQAEINDLKTKIDAFTGWKVGSFGTIGANLSSFNSWAKGANPNSISTSIGGAFSVVAKLNENKYFWDNNLGLALGWQKLDTNTSDDEGADFEPVTDNLRFNSLFGYKIKENLAASALLDYNTAFLNNFNEPGILDFGVGATWTPAPNLRVVVHPINMHLVFLGGDTDNQSALGTKLLVDYSRELIPGLSWRTNFTAFQPYTSNDPDPSLREWTWTNGLGFNIFKGIGVGVDFALRDAAIENDGLQSYYVVGASYAF